MNWKWYLSDLKDVPKNGLKVFSCFSCGGGSTMGYKMAGCTVLGNVEIDPKMNMLYKKNHNPKYNFNMDIRKFKKLPDDKIPDELFDLDILDGSPPCSSFSMAGAREKGWGKKKKFREGQKEQTLDDLFFDFIDVVEKLKPKVVIAENVKGMISGNAKGYVREVIKRYKEAGYETQIFLLNAALMGVPQSRERVFFVSKRIDLHLPKVKMDFREKPIPYGEVEKQCKVKVGKPISQALRKWYFKTPAGLRLADVHPKGSFFSYRKLHPEKVAVTLTASTSGTHLHPKEPCGISDEAIIGLQSFPQDYDFMDQNVQYVCGMSVPPLMMKGVASEVIRQCFGKELAAHGNSKAENR
ncbi:DNA cytosine methyltransferase [Bacillaceae bacterium C204]|uniref:DNA cytosine methyltransferase n=1 Tax=Neobacillus sp. 204 TaxID=3383351 RepID=UPI00397D3E79